MSKVKFRGFPVEWNGDEVRIVPSLSMRQVQDNEDEIKKFGDDLKQSEQIALSGKFIHLALSRNYPDMTMDEVRENLDLGNLAEVAMAILGQSGFKVRTEAEARIALGTVNKEASDAKN